MSAGRTSRSQNALPLSFVKITAQFRTARVSSGSIEGSFKGDADAAAKIALLAEVAGVAALGYATQHRAPKAVVLLGRTAENGKSQVLDMLRGLLPPDAVSFIPPSKFGDEKYTVRLVGKLLNTSDELGSAAAIASDGFKSIITGEPITARDVYQRSFSFRPEAQNVFAANQLPSFHGGMDKGVLRRLLVVVFNRTIPPEERIEHIGQRIAHEELNLLLAWAVQGASRFLRRGYFAEPESTVDALAEWSEGADPVLGWLQERVDVVVGAEAPRLMSIVAYSDFKIWAHVQGYVVPAKNVFVQRLKAAVASKGVTHMHSGPFRGFVGMKLRPMSGELKPSEDLMAAAA